MPCSYNSICSPAVFDREGFDKKITKNRLFGDLPKRREERKKVKKIIVLVGFLCCFVFSLIAVAQSTAPTTQSTVVVGSLDIQSPAQPEATIAPAGATRLAFTAVVLVNQSSTIPVSVTGIRVQRNGLSNDGALKSVMLLDEVYNEIGTPQVLDDNHQALIGGLFKVLPGSSRTVLVAGNMALDETPYVGQTISLAVTGVDTDVTVTGILPIIGATHVVNATLKIGTANTYLSVFDPNGPATRRVGTKRYRFSGINVIAGSAEQGQFQSIVFTQNGTACADDLSNVEVVVGGIAYPTEVNGRRYTASFVGQQVLFDKGFSNDIFIQGDLNQSAVGKTVRMDIADSTDVYVVGGTYGFGLSLYASLVYNGWPTEYSHFTGETPWFSGSVLTVYGHALTVSFSSGEKTVIAGSAQVDFGTYLFDATGSSEDIRVFSIPGTLAVSVNVSASDLSGLALYDQTTDPTTALTTGVNRLNPSAVGHQLFILDVPLVIPKGTVKTIPVLANVRSGVAGTYQWSLSEESAISLEAVSVQSAQSISVTILPSSGMLLHAVPNGGMTITQGPSPSITENSNGTDVFFAINITPQIEAFYGGLLAFSVEVNPTIRWKQGNGLSHPRLINQDFSILIESILIPQTPWPPERADVSTYVITFDLTKVKVPQDVGIGLFLTMEYDNGLQTGDEVSVFPSGEWQFTGDASGMRITLPDFPSAYRQTTVIRRVPKHPVGDLNGDGKIDTADLALLQAAVASLKVIPGQGGIPLREWDIYPDGRIDEWDIAALDSYLKGIFLTLPVGDLNYDWRLTTVDIALARRGILGIQVLTAIELLQADINGSGSLTTLDIALMRRLILGNGTGR